MTAKSGVARQAGSYTRALEQSEGVYSEHMWLRQATRVGCDRLEGRLVGINAGEGCGNGVDRTAMEVKLLAKKGSGRGDAGEGVVVG